MTDILHHYSALLLNEIKTPRRALPANIGRQRAISRAARSEMGAGSSSLLAEEVEELSGANRLSTEEVQHLYARFQKLDRGERGKLSVDALLMIPELAMNPLAERIAALFEDANFRQFVELLSVFGANADPSLKRGFLFRVYDIDGDGFVSKEDLAAVMRMLLGEENVSEAQLEKLVESVVVHADKDGDGRISEEEFAGAVDLEHVKRHCTVSL